MPHSITPSSRRGGSGRRPSTCQLLWLGFIGVSGGSQGCATLLTDEPDSGPPLLSELGEKQLSAFCDRIAEEDVRYEREHKEARCNRTSMELRARFAGILPEGAADDLSDNPVGGLLQGSLDSLGSCEGAYDACVEHAAGTSGPVRPQARAECTAEYRTCDVEESEVVDCRASSRWLFYEDELPWTCSDMENEEDAQAFLDDVAARQREYESGCLQDLRKACGNFMLDLNVVPAPPMP